jgi:hypothetical protein
MKLGFLSKQKIKNVAGADDDHFKGNRS